MPVRIIRAGFFVAAAWSSIHAQEFSADPHRIEERIQALGKFGANVAGGVNPLAFSDADLAGRAYISELMRPGEHSARWHDIRAQR